MDPLVSTFVLPAATSIVIAYIISKMTLQEIKRKAESELINQYASRYNEKKWNAYTRFTSIAKRQIELSMEMDALQVYDALENDVWEIAADLFLIGSDDVIRKFRSWRIHSMMNGPVGPETTGALTDLLIAMRSDLGYTETDLGLDEILGSLVPNYQRVL